VKTSCPPWTARHYRTKKTAITPEYVNSEAMRIRIHAEEAAGKQSAKIEKALGGDGDLLEVLRVYASMHHWN
jgi:hypothetical protein